MATTRNLFFSTRKEGRFVVSFNCAWFLNLLTRMSLLVTPKINDRPLMECHQKLASHYMTYKNKVPSYWKYAGYEFILASELHLIASKSWFNLTSLWGSKSHKYSPVKPIELNVQRLYSINVRGLERQEENSGMTSIRPSKSPLHCASEDVIITYECGFERDLPIRIPVVNRLRGITWERIAPNWTQYLPHCH